MTAKSNIKAKDETVVEFTLINMDLKVKPHCC